MESPLYNVCGQAGRSGYEASVHYTQLVDLWCNEVQWNQCILSTVHLNALCLATCTRSCGRRDYFHEHMYNDSHAHLLGRT